MDIQKAMKNLTSRGFDVKYFEDRQAVIDEVMFRIGTGHTVGIGGSMTVDQLGLYDKLKEAGNDIAWHWRADETNKQELFKKAMFSDFYLTSCNAIGEDGKLVNIDNTGNRVAAMFFGPKEVIMIVGVNKIVDAAETMERIKAVACPQNGRRLARHLPCALTDKCTDCNSKERMCVVTTVIERKPPAMQFHIFIVNETLGF